MPLNNECTPFNYICDKFYDRIEEDKDYFEYYGITVSEAVCIAHKRAVNYLVESLDDLTAVGNLQIDFSDYDAEIEQVNFKLLPKEIRLIVEMMFLKYMKRDEAKLHTLEVNFTPSDLKIFSPANERTSYRNFIKDLTDKVDIKLDNYKNRDRVTGVLRKTIDYTAYNEEE